MTDRELIDHFAGLAMQAFIANKQTDLANTWTEESLKEIADAAYAMATFMEDHRSELIDGGVI